MIIIVTSIIRRAIHKIITIAMDKGTPIQVVIKEIKY